MRFFVVPIILIALLSAAPDASAAGPGPRAVTGGKAGGEAQAPARQEPLSLDDLFGRLARAKSQGTATRISGEIQQRWLQSGSDTADLLMARAVAAIAAKDLPMALDLLDAVIQIKPDFAEAWNQRAIVHFSRKEFDAAVQDVDVTLRLEPRHYGALVGLGTILAEHGYKERALAAFRRALEIHPFLDGVPKRIQALSVEIEGQKT